MGEVKVALIPAYNEERTIANVVFKTLNHVDLVVVCDDGSKDNTSHQAEAFERVKLIRHNRNLGKGASLRDLFYAAIESNADEVVTLDADGQHDPEDIPKLLRSLETADIVIGSRKGIPRIRSVGNQILSGFTDFDTQSGFRAYRGSILHSLIPSETREAADTEIFREARRLGLMFAQEEISVNYDVPKPSKSNLFPHFLTVFLSDFKLLAVEHPGLLYGVPGLVILIIALVLAYNARQYLLTEGLGSVMLFILALFLLAAGAVIWTNMTMIKRMRK